MFPTDDALKILLEQQVRHPACENKPAPTINKGCHLGIKSNFEQLHTRTVV